MRRMRKRIAATLIVAGMLVVSAPPAYADWKRNDNQPCAKPHPTEDPAWQTNALGVQGLWRFATGKNQTVAVIDTGVNKHPRLTDGGRLTGGRDFVDPPANGLVDCDGHGTIVAGLIAASWDQKPGGFGGMAPQAKIISYRNTSKKYTNQAAGNDAGVLADAINDAVRNGARVINISEAGCGAGTPALRDAVAAAVRANTVVVAAAGNLEQQGNGPCSKQNTPDNVVTEVIPAVYDQDVLTVASTAQDGGLSDFSITGPWVDVAAPGERIVSLDGGEGANSTSNIEPDQGTPNGIRGTSFAAPLVAGLAALVRERYPNLDARQVMRRIERTSSHPSGPDNRDQNVGYGVINPQAALTAVLPEEGDAGKPAAELLMSVNGPQAPSKWPMIVSLSVTGAAFVGLLLTAFIVFTVKRNRRQAT
ncbi:type VII secretion-associated serine protease mycosin [Pseudonocardiaceae bacterium YIM PH 21723]|nr:type VII secretion-associated serine protease mycosin [Pseudonocardiaceae bacterium YIM PH 21723]